MTDTFNTSTDNVDAGNNTFGNAVAADTAGQTNTGGENNLQSQIAGMEKRISDKDTHISTVESENLKLREQMAETQEKLEKMAKIEEALERMQANQNGSTQDTALDENALINKTLEALDEKKREATAEENFNAVSAELTKQFGADAVDGKVAQIAKNNGLSFDDIVDLAKKSPNAVYTMAGLKGITSPSTSPSRSSNIGFNNDDDGSSARERKLAEFAKMRRENASLYWKPETQKEFRKLFD
jgi:hypothetical protein